VEYRRTTRWFSGMYRIRGADVEYRRVSEVRMWSTVVPPGGLAACIVSEVRMWSTVVYPRCGCGVPSCIRGADVEYRRTTLAA
jgi:hypothetical protein